jgi:hypothetical protein
MPLAMQVSLATELQSIWKRRTRWVSTALLSSWPRAESVLLSSCRYPALNSRQHCWRLLAQFMQDQIDMDLSETMLWTDSITILKYLRNESRRFHVFVANRVTKIKDISTLSQWRYVPTSQNPAVTSTE